MYCPNFNYNYPPELIEPVGKQVLVFPSRAGLYDGLYNNNYYSINISKSNPSIEDIRMEIDKFINYAYGHPELEFFVSDTLWDRVGLTIKEAALLFKRVIPLRPEYNHIVPIYKQIAIVASKNVRLRQRLLIEIILDCVQQMLQDNIKEVL